MATSESSITDHPSVVDPDSAQWMHDLQTTGAVRDAAVARLHALLLRVARGELHRRGGMLRIAGPEVDDLAFQAAGDAVVAILGKVATFRGESRFTTWAYRFVVLEVSSKLGRHFRRNPEVSWDAEQWERLPDRFGLDPARESQWRDLAAAIRRAVDADLTAWQRRVFVAVVLNEVPLDVLVVEFGSSRNTIYKTVFDSRRKLRAVLVANGYLPDDPVRLP